ncbi:MAG: 30S ribosomal protein S2 [Candidatus Yanofskybacteria bacterium RIFCSPHIGHO2_02_FULL_39_10]|uniref:Small ribosomal subunit protein uS2 n=1 Tax=Candidatus Yanofskybacteria bacterium RIFCSPHIGHO2_02_FULL_39_10 TaxID=1802674 RepID=A0A1F8F5W1_9BACT|nr:MAG: 30S ribosomal protein S2 [Candidatus Yanofskybacteria bacterium RIFCSPHIGHO2_02_FULL_39_10]
MSEQAIQLNYEDMLKAGMHFGRKKTVFNPKMKKYVFTIKEGICIIDLLKTQSELNAVAEYLKNSLSGTGLVLFVGLTKQSSDSMKGLAEALNMPYIIDRWIGGTLTNFKIISARVKRLEEMEKDRDSGALDKYTKKERLMFDREIKKMEQRFGGLRKLSRIPDVVFVSSLKESALPVHEAQKTGVKVVAITNTDANPEDADYVIPANDRSKKAIDLIIEALKVELSSK